MRLLLTGGGTAGHIYPLLAVLDELKKQVKDERLEVLYIGTKGGIEEKILKQEAISAFFIFSGKWRRYWFRWLPAFFQNILDLFKIVLGFFQAFFALIKFQPDIILAKGGYVTIPVVFASLFTHSPIVTHESDIVMGFSNRLSTFFAKKICVSFPLKYYPRLPKNKLIETGNPVRREFLHPISNNLQTTNDLPSLKLRRASQRLTTILITGGSQGSRMINRTIFAILLELLEFSQIVHIAGFDEFKEAEQTKEKLNETQKKRYFIYDFLEKEMPEKMANADLIISRAGANTLAEIAALGKPSILIPLKYAARDHQRKNAKIFGECGASAVLIEEALSPEKLLKEIKKILKNQKLLKKMGENARMLSHPEAAKKIAGVVLEERKR